MSLGRRRLTCLALPALVAGCGASPDPVLYTLQMKPGPVLPSGPRVVQLRDIGLASYLDRREIVRSSADYKLGVMANDWWGEPLGSLLSRIIILGLSQRLPNSRIYAEGGAISADPNAVVGVNIQRMDRDASGSLELIAQGAVEFNRPARSASRAFHIVKAPPTNTVAGQVAATSDAIAELTDGLATLLQP
jgi:uncharacterized lipoprotein YmbA